MTPADLTPWRISPCSSCNRPAGQRCRTASGAVCPAHAPRLTHFAGWLSRQTEVDGLTTEGDLLRRQFAAAVDTLEQRSNTIDSLSAERDGLAQRVTKAETSVSKLTGQAIEQIGTIADLRAQLAALTKPEPIPGRRVFAAAMPWFWRGETTFDNAFLNPAGEKNLYLVRGGQVRDKTLNLPKGEWVAADYTRYIAAGKRAGLDGFWWDITTPKDGNENYERVKLMAKASVDAGFLGVPMLDGKGKAFLTGPDAMTPEAVADQVAKLLAVGVSFFDGAHWVGSFKADGDKDTGLIAGVPTVDYWTRLLTALRAKVDKPVKFTAMMLNPTDARIKAMATVADHIAFWGHANPANVDVPSNFAKQVRAAGAEPAGVVIPQDWRPRESKYAEANNTELLRKTAGQAIADNVQHLIFRTYDDYAESTQVCPTLRSGTAWADLCSYYAHRFRYGQPPVLSAPWTVTTKRTQLAAAKPSMDGQTPVVCTLDGGGTPRDDVETLTLDNDGEHITLAPLVDPGVPKVADLTYVATAGPRTWE